MSTKANEPPVSFETWQRIQAELHNMGHRPTFEEALAVYLKHGMPEHFARIRAHGDTHGGGIANARSPEERQRRLARLSHEEQMEHKVADLCWKELPKPEHFFPITDPVELLGKRGTAQDLDSYLAQNGDINGTSANGTTLAKHAARFDNLPLLKVLAEKGACLQHLLHTAIICRSESVVHYLVDELHHDVNEKLSDGVTPLHCTFNCPELRPFLVSRGAK